MLVATTPGQEPWVAPESGGSDGGSDGAAAGAGAVAGLRPALAAVAALRRPAPDAGRITRIAGAAELARWGPGRAPGWLAEDEAKLVLAAAGITVPRGVRIELGDRGAAEETLAARAISAARGLRWPLAAKLSSAGLLHKSESGALALDLRDRTALRAAARRLLRLSGREPGVRLLVEEMAPPGVELVVAARRDGVVPALVIGLGGVWTEALDDVVVVPLPAEPDVVLAALRRLRAATVLSGGRGRAPVDLDSLAVLAHRTGELLIAGGFSLIELNPVIVGPIDAGDAMAGRSMAGSSMGGSSMGGAVAVDALARR
jgi:hypothetical protein